jgi:hypothetical protein
MNKTCIGIIYFTVCLLDGMSYVGYHNTSANDGYFGSGIYVKNAIKLHGKQNFRRIILDHYSTEKERTYKEILWIDRFDLLNKKIGYNIDKGGGGSFSGKNNPITGRKQTKEHITKRIHKKRPKHSLLMMGNNNPSKRLEVRKKLSERQIGEKNHGSKRVLCYNLLSNIFNIFTTLKECCKHTDTSKTYVSKCIKNKKTFKNIYLCVFLDKEKIK